MSQDLVSTLSRRCFLESTAAATCSALLLGGCQSGGGSEGSVSPTGGMAQLTFAMFPKLQTVGSGVVADLGGELIAVIRTGDMTATALSAVCTHSGCTVEIQTGSAPLFCPCHGSKFSESVVVIRGPARTSLRVHTATVDAAGVTVTLG